MHVWGPQPSVLRGHLEGNERRVGRTAGLPVVRAVLAVGGHVCGVHLVALLEQVVVDSPAAVMILGVAVVRPRDELPEVCATGVLDDGVPSALPSAWPLA